MIYLLGALVALYGLSKTKLVRMFFLSDTKLTWIYGLWRNNIESLAPTKYRHIVGAIIAVESSGNPNAVSYADAVGLMQITPIVLIEYNRENNTSYSKDDLFSAFVNMNIGIWYFRRLIERYNLSVYDALRAYNAGIGNVKKSQNISSGYALKVLAYSQRLSELVTI